MHFNTHTTILTIAALLGSCSYRASTPIEVIMCPGDVIEYRASGGRSLKILATGEIERQYVIGDSLRFTVDLTPRPSRWYGSRGVYRASGVGNTHMVLEEAVQHFSSIEEVNEWLDSKARQYDDRITAINESGLVVAWKYDARPPGHQGGPDYLLSVEVYQIVVNLNKPQGLRRVSDDTISKNLSNPCDAKTFEPGYMPSKPAEIHGRMYSGRALHFMLEQGYSSGEVERLISNGTRREHGAKVRQDGTHTVYNSKPVDRPHVVRVDAAGRIVSIS